MVELKEIIKIKEFSPDIIIAVGGGSVIDYAKIANVLTDSSNIDKEIANSTYEIKKFSKLVAFQQQQAPSRGNQMQLCILIR